MGYDSNGSLNFRAFVVLFWSVWYSLCCWGLHWSVDAAWVGGIFWVARYLLVKEGYTEILLLVSPSYSGFFEPGRRVSVPWDQVASGTRLPSTELLTVTGLFLIPPPSCSVSGQGKKSLQAWGTKGLHQLGHLLSLGFSSWFLLPTLVSFHGKEDSLAQQRRMLSLFLAGLLVGPPCMRLSERLPLDPTGRMSYWATFCC